MSDPRVPFKGALDSRSTDTVEKLFEQLAVACSRFRQGWRGLARKDRSDKTSNSWRCRMRYRGLSLGKASRTRRRESVPPRPVAGPADRLEGFRGFNELPGFKDMSSGLTCRSAQFKPERQPQGSRKRQIHSQTRQRHELHQQLVCLVVEIRCPGDVPARECRQ